MSQLPSSAHETSDHFEVRILRQDAPGRPSYWERHRLRREPDMNVISVLQRIAAQATTVDRKRVAPVAWECNCLEEVCGACSMLINGRVRQACTALVDSLLADHPQEIELQPMSKFPVVRDLVVDRSRLFAALRRVKAWIPVDGYHDMGRAPRQSPIDHESVYPLSQCMSCGCCLEACPQYVKLDMARADDESAEEFERRKAALYERAYIGAHAISQVVRFNIHPLGKSSEAERLDALIEEGGIQLCGNAQNCVVVCPKNIPLTASIGQAGRATTLHVLHKWFDR